MPTFSASFPQRRRVLGAGIQRTRRRRFPGRIPPRYQPRPPQPQAPTPLPFNARYETSVSQANRDHDLGQSQLGAEGASVRQRFGFDDPTDPFSQAAVLQRTYESTRRGTGNNYGRSGQLYSGAMSNARAIDERNFNQNYDELRRNYQAALGDLSGRGLDLANERSDRIAEAEARRLEDALSEPVDPEEAHPGYLTRNPNRIRQRMIQLRRNRPRAFRGQRRQMLTRYRRAVQERRQY